MLKSWATNVSFWQLNYIIYLDLNTLCTVQRTQQWPGCQCCICNLLEVWSYTSTLWSPHRLLHLISLPNAYLQMSQQEPSDPTLINWPSRAELDPHTFILCTSPVLLWKSPAQTLGEHSSLGLPGHISHQLLCILSAGARQGLGNVPVSGTGLLMRSSPWVTSPAQLSQTILEQPHHGRCCGFPFPSCVPFPACPCGIKHWTGRGWAAWPHILSCKNF